MKKLQKSKEQIVLLSVLGLSPAVLTETIWALAQERPAVIPDQVVVITTLVGQRIFEQELLTPVDEYGAMSVWNALRLELLGKNAHKIDRLTWDLQIIKVPQAGQPRPLEDIRTRYDNEAAADFIMEEVRKITANPDVCLIASIAGGRKTMSAILYACMSLLGRKDDRLTHVLVNEPFESPRLRPRFYVPSERPVMYQFDDGKGRNLRVPGRKARIELANLPFVRLGTLFDQKFRRPPGKFNTLVRMCSERIEKHVQRPKVRLRRKQLSFFVCDEPLPLSAAEYALMEFLIRSGKRFPNQDAAIEPLANWLEELVKALPVESQGREEIANWHNELCKMLNGERTVDSISIRRRLNSIRRKVEKAGFGHLVALMLPKPREFFVEVDVAD